MGGIRHRLRRPHHRAHRARPAGAAIAPELLTVGHGRLDGEGLRSLLTDAGVELVVDIRRFPGSRANPAASRDAIERELAAGGIAWRWEERLGGRRRLSAAADAASPDGWWRVDAFRAYAGWTRSPEFSAGFASVLADASARRTAVMCSEAVWWRCHRRVVADVAVVLHGLGVTHLMHDGSLRRHEPSETATVVDGAVVWPPAQPG